MEQFIQFESLIAHMLSRVSFYRIVLLLQLTGQAVCYQHLRSRTGDVVRVFREFEDQFDRGYRRGKGGRRGEEIERFRIFRKHYVEVARMSSLDYFSTNGRAMAVLLPHTWRGHDAQF